MATKKKPWHKKKLHHNRFLIWTLVVCFIMAGLLVSYVYLTKLEIDRNTSNENVDLWHTYKTSDVSVKYPASWVVDTEPGVVSFGPKDQDAFWIYSYNPPNDAAYSIYQNNPDNRSVTVNGLPGIEIFDNSSNPASKIVLIKTNSTLYEFRGTTPLFNRILNTVRLTK